MQGLTDPAAAQVREVAEEAIQRARRGEGPTLIEAETYRFRGHSLADPDELRLKEEKEHYQVRARRAARLGAGAAAACMLGAGRTSRVRRGVPVSRLVRLLHKLRGRRGPARATTGRALRAALARPATQQRRRGADRHHPRMSATPVHQEARHA
jgi:hypothetical protein